MSIFLVLMLCPPALAQPVAVDVTVDASHSGADTTITAAEESDIAMTEEVDRVYALLKAAGLGDQVRVMLGDRTPEIHVVREAASRVQEIFAIGPDRH